MKRNILIAALLLTPCHLMAEEGIIEETKHTYDPENLCMFEDKLYSLGTIIKVEGKEHKCIYKKDYRFDTVSKKTGAMWGTYNEPSKSFLP